MPIDVLITDMGLFDGTNWDTPFNLDCICKMQDRMQARNEQYSLAAKRPIYGGEIPVEFRFPGGPSEYSKALPLPATRLNYDTDDYQMLFKEHFRMGYSLQMMGRILDDKQHHLEPDDFKWPMQWPGMSPIRD